MNLKSLENETLLLLGKTRAFSKEEFALQIKYQNLNIVDTESEDITMVVEGRMMTPYEQNLSDSLYEEKQIPSISIDSLEKELVALLDNDTLLMSLKLSHDKERLKSFIQNSCISDVLFFRLIKMYDWCGEDFFENDDNRDVSAAFIARFYENIERNHNVQYATTGFIHLVSQAKTTQLLGAIADLEPLKFHPKIMMAIAMSGFCDATMQKKLHKKRDKHIDEALSFNKNLTTQLTKEFLKDEVLGANIVSVSRVNEDNFEDFISYKYALAKNETLTTQMQKNLLALDDMQLNQILATNPSLDTSLVLELLQTQDKETLVALYKNKAMPVHLLEKAYADGIYVESIAQNENTPVEILYQLQLDSRYERYVKTNASFGKHIQSENIGWLT